MRVLPKVKQAQYMVGSFHLPISKPVLDAMSRLPRDKFVPAELREAAYSDQALGIGKGQTISQPSLVALMTDLLDLKASDKVLEIGTGSGYQAAILAQLARQVFTVEYERELAASAELRLMKLGIDNVTVVVGDGSEGYNPEALYEAIIVTAASPTIPQNLVEQLKVGGRLVIPVGSRQEQELTKVVKTAGGLEKTSHGLVYFVPLLGKYGWQS
ncbi:MAG: protein-L-isoaspartate(D-aspartate) O-methyltransferase [bacterium]|nr:protein-L-isoaspartate(D-aspartate) O-methyltransferase [bacterium]